MSTVNIRLHQRYESFIPKIVGTYKHCQGPLEFGSKTGIPHYHFVIEGPIKTIQTRIYNLGIKGNENYSSSKTENLISSISYACKTGPPVSYNLGTPYETVPQWVFPTAVEQKKKEYKRLGVCQTIINNCPKNIENSEVFNYIWDSYGHTNSPYDEMHIYRIYNSIMCQRDDREHKKLMKTKLTNLLMKNKYLSL